MKRRVARLLLVFVMMFTMAPKVLAATAEMANFKKVNTYAPGQFTDVKTNDWFAASVQSAYEMGLVKGNSATTYNPTGNITIAETAALASRIHNIYQGGNGQFVQGIPWYQVYVDYATAAGIIKYSYDYSAVATRSQFAEIIAASMPSDALPTINNIADNALPDVKITDPYGTAVYRLYRAGILTGSDEYGTFNPNSNIQRSEVAAILARMTSANQRKIFTLKAKPHTELSAEVTTQAKAFGLLKDFIFSNSNTTLSGDTAFEISNYDGNTLEIYTLFCEATDGSIVVSYELSKSSSSSVSYLRLTPDEDEFIAILFFYGSDQAAGGDLFAASRIKADEFTGRESEIDLIDYEGDPMFKGIMTMLLKGMISDSLDFANYALQLYSSSYGLNYGMKDFGFTALFN